MARKDAPTVSMATADTAAHGAAADPTGPIRVRSALAAGATLGSRFQILRSLGEGGTGNVFAARDLLLHEDVAVKVLHRQMDESAGALRKLRDEVRAARRIAHPNVCRVHDLGEQGGLVFLIMELLAGDTLRRRLRGSIPLGEAVEIVRQLGGGLAAAHRAGVVHCDVKPENALLVGGRAVLTDFGIARILGPDRAAGASGQLEGTPAYMSPEQLAGGSVDERTDVFALATLAAELLLGRHPFAQAEHEEFQVLSERIRTRPPQLPDEEPAALPAEARAGLRRVIERGLAKDPRERFETVDALVAAIVAAIGADLTRAAARAQATELPDAITPSGATTPAPGTGRVSVRRTSARGSRRVATIVHVIVEETGSEEADEGAGHAEALVAATETALLDAGGEIVSRAPRTVVAVFGAMRSDGDEPQRAADAARAVTAAGGRDVAARAGIDTGRMLVRIRAGGGLGGLSGDALAKAAALAGTAAPGEVRASARTARHLARRFDVESVAGGDAVRLGARRPAEVSQRIHPLVGREDELARVTSELVSALRDGRPRAVLVLGPAGIGKSRLRREVEDQLASRGAFRTLSIAARPDDVVASHAGLRALVGQLLSLGERPSPEEVEGATRRLLGGEPDAALLDALVDFLAPAPAFGGLYGGAGRSPVPVAAAARAALAAAARVHPLLIVVDDAHWIDDATLDLLETVARGEVEAPLAILAQARPELSSRRPRARASFTLCLDLTPLGPETARELAAVLVDRMGGREPPPDAGGAPRDLAREIADASDGHPFFIEELARDLLERGAAAGALPTTVEEAIQARLDRMPEEQRDVVRAAAVLGRTFRRGDLARLISALEEQAIDAAELDAELSDLEARRILFALPQDAAADDRYAIKHALIRDVAYRELAPAARRQLHAAAARLLQERGQDAHELAGELARHLEGAGDPAGAAQAYRRAGELADAEDAAADAFRCYGRALELLGGAAAGGSPAGGAREAPRAPVDDVVLLTRLGDAAVRAGAFADAERALDRAITAAGEDRRAAANALRVRSNLSRQRARWEEAAALTRRGLALLEGGPGGDPARDPVLAAQLHASLGWVLGYILGECDEGLAECLRAVELLGGTPHLAELAQVYGSLGGVYMRMGRWRDQLECNRKNLAIGEQLRSLALRCRAHLNLGVNLQGLGETEESIAHSRRAIELSERMCVTTTVGLARCNLGIALIDAGRIDEASREIDEAIRLSELCGGLYYHYEAVLMRARIAVRRGDLPGARAHAEAAVERARAEGGKIDEGISRKFLGAILSLAGAHDAAAAALDEAAALLVHADQGETARILAERARAALRRGDPAAAAPLLAGARARLEALGATLDLAHLDDVGWI